MVPRIRIEDVLPSGEKITIMLEGSSVTEKRVIQVMELLRLMGGGVEEQNRSIKNEVMDVLGEYFGDGSWFTLRDAYVAVIEAGLDLKLSSLATYIHRLVREGRLEKRGSRPRTMYRVIGVRPRIGGRKVL